MSGSTYESAQAVLDGEDEDDFVQFDAYRIWRSGPARFIDHLLDRARTSRPTLACYLNAWTYNLARSHKELHHAFTQADLLYPDGTSIAAACTLAGGGRPTRMTAADFFDEFCRKCQRQRLKLYFVSSKRRVIERACDRLRSKFPGLEIVGYHHGYLNGDQTQIARLLADINSKRPDVLILGMGSPRQESFAAQYRSRLTVPVIWTIGALMEYYAGTEKLAPRWLSRSGLEWLYRLYQDPLGKGKRYLVGNVLFAIRAGAAAVRQRIQRRGK